MTWSYFAGPPPFYTCSNCEASGCKLWRQFNVFANHVSLLCGPCALVDQGADWGAEITHEGKVLADKSVYGLPSDAICSLVPAVPVGGMSEGSDAAYWGYSNVPDAGVLWWRALPSYPETSP